MQGTGVQPPQVSSANSPHRSTNLSSMTEELKASHSLEISGKNDVGTGTTVSGLQHQVQFHVAICIAPYTYIPREHGKVDSTSGISVAG